MVFQSLVKLSKYCLMLALFSPTLYSVNKFMTGILIFCKMLFVRFSGVTEESLSGVSTTIREVQAVLLSMIHKDTILVGHSLESDLKATKVMWNSKRFDLEVINSVRIFPLNRQTFTRLVDFWWIFS